MAEAEQEQRQNMLTDNQDGDSQATPISLKRSLGLPGAISFLVGTIIGSGIFATPKWVLLYVGSVGMSLVMWTLCGMIALFSALCYCELGTLIPKSGAEYPYLLEAYGALPAFLYSWVFVLFSKPSGVMILLVFGAYIIEPFFPGCGGREDLMPLVKLIVAAAMDQESQQKSSSHCLDRYSPCDVMLFAGNIGYFTVLTPQEVLDSDAVAVTLANRLYGVMAWTIPILVACSTFGTANGNAFAGGRLTFAAAREGQLPRFLAMIHTKRRTPLPGLIFSSIISWLMLIPDSTTFEVLLNYFTFFGWLGYGVSISSILWLRYKRPDAHRPYKVWIGIPIFMVMVSAYLVFAPFYEAPLQSFYCLLFVSAGIPFYLVFVRFKVAPQSFLCFVDRVTYKLQKVCDVAFPESEEDIIS
ncbi:hypothetical protein ACROYT_G029301 [Oculina patagonica]